MTTVLGILDLEFPVLETARLRLRQLVQEDADALFRLFASEELMRYYGRHPMAALEEAGEMIERHLLLFEELRGIRWGIELKENGQLIGTAGFHAWVHPYQRAEIGYELDQAYQGKGLAKEALTAAIDYAFSTMGINRIGALVYPENENSARLLERLDFELEGLLKQYALFRDRYQDLNMYALLKEQWVKRNV
ncbi:GNAT family N-acetyltransferase [Paenibacillus terreus]|uniref:GNAT family N-acetyltransferase n=1 Tax=Paenibacillus terreus TaxID=1387834 RepID=A0ABV5BCJ8_9BACL